MIAKRVAATPTRPSSVSSIVPTRMDFIELELGVFVGAVTLVAVFGACRL